uniref:Uncharacterized protein n=1 Tax=Cucumis melo TaxID=3656 RepID=A0A9I9E8H6_CUCME
MPIQNVVCDGISVLTLFAGSCSSLDCELCRTFDSYILHSRNSANFAEPLAEISILVARFQLVAEDSCCLPLLLVTVQSLFKQVPYRVLVSYASISYFPLVFHLFCKYFIGASFMLRLWMEAFVYRICRTGDFMVQFLFILWSGAIGLRSMIPVSFSQFRYFSCGFYYELPSLRLMVRFSTFVDVRSRTLEKKKKKSLQLINSSVWLWPLERIKFCTISFNFSQKNGSGFKVMAAAKSKLNSTSKYYVCDVA